MKNKKVKPPRIEPVRKNDVWFVPVEALTAEQRLRKRIGRNEPCPCGSGEKFKKCHMKDIYNIQQGDSQ